MALKFNQASGAAKKSSIDQYTYKEGDNIFRLVGDILPRYAVSYTHLPLPTILLV